MNIGGQLEGLNNDDHFEDNDPDVVEVSKPANEFDKEEPIVAKLEPVKNPFDTDNEPIQTSVIGDKIIADLLKQKGISDSKKILYEDEKGVISEKDFSELPYEDQLNILSSTDYDSFTEEDLALIKEAKDNNLSLIDLFEHYKNRSVEEYVKSQQPTYLVADYTDEELYVLDMKAKFGEEFTNEEILQLLQKELEIPEIFKKKVDKLRQEYTILEDEERTQQANLITEQKKADFLAFGDTIRGIVSEVEDIAGVSLEDNDKNDILKFMLETDTTGATEFQKLMNDPQNVFLAAWAILKAEDTFDVLKTHYESLIKQLKKQPGKSDEGTRATVVRLQPAARKIMGVEDLHNFD